MLFSEIKLATRNNLNDAGIISYSVQDLNDSVKDAYDDIVVNTQCIVKKVTLNYIANLTYYDLSSLVADYLVCVAIYDVFNKFWLDDDMTVRDFEFVRRDWELAKSTPKNWAALDHKHVAIFPKYADITGKTFDLYYWATSPSVVDSDIPLVPLDFHKLIPDYSTADLLESYEEFTKANLFWAKYYADFAELKRRIKNLSHSDLLFKI